MYIFYLCISLIKDECYYYYELKILKIFRDDKLNFLGSGLYGMSFKFNLTCLLKQEDLQETEVAPGLDQCCKDQSKETGENTETQQDDSHEERFSFRCSPSFPMSVRDGTRGI